MTIPNSPEQKLIEALDEGANAMTNLGLNDSKIENAIVIAHSLLAELAELREKASLLDTMVSLDEERLSAKAHLLYPNGLVAMLADRNRQMHEQLTLVTQERDALRKKLDEAYERAAQLAYEYCSDSGLTTKTQTNHGSRLSAEIRALKTEGT